MRLAVLLLIVPVLAGCDPDIGFAGARWDEEGQCWRSEVAFEAPRTVDALTVWTRDPEGTCWYFASYPSMPPGWDVIDGTGCEEVPEALWEPTAESMCR